MLDNGLLKVDDSKLESVTGGCLIDMNYDGSVNFAKFSKAEFEFLRRSKCLNFGRLRVHSLPKAKACLRNAGFRVVVKTTVIPRYDGRQGYDIGSLSSLAVKCIVE